MKYMDLEIRLQYHLLAHEAQVQVVVKVQGGSHLLEGSLWEDAKPHTGR
jgi:hypothetical protein